MSDRRRRLLLIDDDEDFASSLAERLRTQFDVRVASDGETGLELAGAVDLVLLDLGLPDVDGSAVCRLLREGSAVPIIVVSRRSDERDRVLLLDLGADDYVIKPVAYDELVARIDAVLRRCRRNTPEPQVLECGALRIDGSSRIVTIDDHEIRLTPREFDLLFRLATDLGAVVRRDRLFEDVWQRPASGGGRALDTHIAGLRRKLGKPSPIVLAAGVGYRLEPLIRPTR